MQNEQNPLKTRCLLSVSVPWLIHSSPITTPQFSRSLLQLTNNSHNKQDVFRPIHNICYFLVYSRSQTKNNTDRSNATSEVNLPIRIGSDAWRCTCPNIAAGCTCTGSAARCIHHVCADAPWFTSDWRVLRLLIKRCHISSRSVG